MKILYGVVGEGMGHAMRSRVVLDHLVARHDVQVVVSGRAYDYLAARASEHLAVRKADALTPADRRPGQAVARKARIVVTTRRWSSTWGSPDTVTVPTMPAPST